MADGSPRLSPLYAAMPMLYYHHDQLWAETPEHFFEQLDHSEQDERFKAVWDQKMGGTGLEKYVDM